jgi:hypothetical protein
LETIAVQWITRNRTTEAVDMPDNTNLFFLYILELKIEKRS